METAHFEGRRIGGCCCCCCWWEGLGGLVAMETAATPYISIHRARLLRRATFHHIINTGGVLPPLSKNYNGVICEWQTAAASAVKVRLIHPPYPRQRRHQLNPACAPNSCQPPSSKVTLHIIYKHSCLAPRSVLPFKGTRQIPWEKGTLCVASDLDVCIK